MQPTDIAGAASAAEANKRRTLWQRVQAWDGQLSVAKGLTIVTVLAGFFGGYFQYLNAYEEKVSEMAQADMKDATSTFLDISNAFAEAQMLQQLIFFDYVGALGARSDAGDNKMVTDAARGTFPDYVKARGTLRQNSNVFARKAEIYIDWASDLDRDPAAPRTLNADPLDEVMLGNYRFDCNADANFPHFKSAGPGAGQVETQLVCKTGGDKELSQGSTTSFCALDENGEIGPAQAKLPSRIINWLSAKHQLLAMHYCFERAHEAIATARIWASNNDVVATREDDFRRDHAAIQSRLDNQVVRLDAFMSLAMSQLERIRVKYRPSGIYCHIPVVRDLIGIVSHVCTPIRTASSQ